MRRVLVIADTHLHGEVHRRLPGALLEAIAGADLVVHAGDLVTAATLDELASMGEIAAVLGNNDHELVGRLPERLELQLEGVRVAVIHDSGDRRGREARLGTRFPNAQIVVFGHSHVPVDQEGIAGQRLFNPGSPTTCRSQPRCSFGWLELAAGALVGHGIEYC